MLKILINTFKGMKCGSFYACIKNVCKMGEKSHKCASIFYCLVSRAAIKKEKHWPFANSFYPLEEDAFFAKGGRD